jgi:hypothetical protein
MRKTTIRASIAAFAASVLVLLPLQTATAANDVIVARRDEPLQVTWFAHRKPPYSKSHEGLLHADTFSWRCYPVIGQTFRADKKALLLKIELDGPGNWSSNLTSIFAIDGDVSEIRFGMNNLKLFTTLGMNKGDKITLTGQEALITKISTASEVWVTIPDGNSGERHSVKLSDAQLQLFREIMERYRSLEPTRN